MDPGPATTATVLALRAARIWTNVGEEAAKAIIRRCPMDDTSSTAQSEELLRLIEAPTIAAALVVVSDAVRLGQVELALELVGVIRAKFGADPGLDLAEVTILARKKRFAEAAACLATLRERSPAFLVPELYAAQVCVELGERERAIEILGAAARRCPDYPGVAGSLASLLMPGPGYRDVLAALHRELRPRGYLEIGVETGATLALANATAIVGVDPDLSVLRRDAVHPRTRLFEMKSEDFFRERSAEEVLLGTPLDLTFIDGMHRYGAALADFAAVEQWSHERSVVVMHDALPVLPIYAEAERRTRFWVGDVWRAVVGLRVARPELRIRIIATPPSGLVVITNLRQANAPLGSFLSVALDAAARADLTERVPPWPRDFPVVRNDLDGIREAFGPR
ncbi:MAG: class I SAM-dependent methyltransferase [Polyangiaceae bacterium]